MRSLIAVAILGFVLATSASASHAADATPPDGAVPKDMLAEMGMAGMETVPDREGARIRGEGCGIRFFTINLIFNWRAPTVIKQTALVGGKTPQTAFAVSHNILIRW